MLTVRLGNFQPFADLAQREDDRYTGIQAGLVTYSETESGEETYQTSYVELGGRCDHLADPIMDMAGTQRDPLLSANACETDAVRLRKAEPKQAQDAPAAA